MAPRRRAGTPSPNRIGVLISGRGSNMAALMDRIEAGDLDASVALVISSTAAADGLATARRRGVETLVLDPHDSADREEHDRRMAAALEERDVRLVCLAGYMYRVTPWFVHRFENRILNIHPSLLPAFPGTHAQRDALRHGARISGCTVHFVDEGVDSGPIMLQVAVPVRDDDTEATLAARILEQEHRLYSRAVALFFAGRLRLEGRRVLGTDDPA